jgi:septal ring factor EnvC (AmiA/AmiB activator)
MSLVANDVRFKSPRYKLLLFFHRSRDLWKTKAKERNRRVKQLTNDVAAVRESREKWKAKAQDYESRIAELEKELDEQKNSAC